MGRSPRLIVKGGTYHIMNRGNRKALIFEDDRDRRRCLKILLEEMERYGVRLLGGTPMGNHFHAVVNTPHGNLPDFMEQWESRFARYSNWRHRRVGHLFQGPYRAVYIEHDVHLLIALCYVFLNPVYARLVTKPEDYPWSTYAATVGLAPCPSYLSIDWLPALFPGSTLKDAQRRLHDLMSATQPVETFLRELDGFGLDAGAVRRIIHSYTGEQLQIGMLPHVYRSALRSPLVALFHDGMTHSARARAIYDAHVAHGYSLAQIARHLRLSPATISKIFRKLQSGK